MKKITENNIFLIDFGINELQNILRFKKKLAIYLKITRLNKQKYCTVQ